MSSNSDSSLLQDCHCCFRLSGSGSSHPRGFSLSLFPMTVSCLSSSFPLKITGAARPKGSYTELMTDSTPLRVNGLSWSVTLKVKVSFSKSQQTPRERWGGSTSWLRSRLQTLFARSLAGIASMTLMELDTTLCNRRFAVASMACAFFMRSTISSSVCLDASPSST